MTKFKENTLNKQFKLNNHHYWTILYFINYPLKSSEYMIFDMHKHTF